MWQNLQDEDEAEVSLQIIVIILHMFDSEKHEYQNV